MKNGSKPSNNFIRKKLNSYTVRCEFRAYISRYKQVQTEGKKRSSSLVDREMQNYELKNQLFKMKDLKYMQEDKAYNKSITKRIDRGVQQHNVLKGLFK